MSLAVETTGLSKSYGPVRAVESVSLRVGQGEIYGFIGRNGAGKTTTIRALLGMIRPDAGSVRMLGEAVGPHRRGPGRGGGPLGVGAGPAAGAGAAHTGRTGQRPRSSGCGGDPATAGGSCAGARGDGVHVEP